MKDEKQETDVHYKYVMILIHAQEICRLRIDLLMCRFAGKVSTLSQKNVMGLLFLSTPTFWRVTIVHKLNNIIT